MTDAAAGSSAALQLQQNMYAAPDVQRQQAMAVQQQEANLERTKLANLVAETGVKEQAQSKEKLQALVKTPEFTKADSAQRLNMLSGVYAETGDMDSFVKAQSAVEKAELTKMQSNLKKQEADGLVIGSAYSAIKDATPEQFVEIVQKFPEEQRKAIEARIPNFFQENNPKLQKAQLENLFQNTSGHNLLATNNLRTQIAEMQKSWRESHDKVLQLIAEGKRSGSGTKEELKEYNAYNRQSRGIDIDTKRELQDAEAKYRKASEEDSKGTYGILSWGGGGASLKQQAKTAEEKSGLASTKAWQELQDIKRGIVERKLNALEGLPEGKEKDRLYNNLVKQLESTQEELPPEKIDKPVTPSAAPAATTPAAAPAKPGTDVPSNKGQGTKTAPMPMPKSPAEAVDGKYYTTKAGVRRWDAKTQLFVE